MVSEAESAQPGSLRITRPGDQAVRARVTTILPPATEAPAVGHTRRGRISMRRSARRLSLPVTLLVTGLLVAGCGGSISSSIGSLPSPTATAPAKPTVTAAGPPPHAPAHWFRGARGLLRHQPDLALGPAGRPCPGRPDRLDRALGSPPLGS